MHKNWVNSRRVRFGIAALQLDEMIRTYIDIILIGAEDGACCLRLMLGCNDALMIRDEAGCEQGIHHIVRKFARITEESSMADLSAATR